MRIISKTLISLIEAYRISIRPFLLGACRFTPSCSSYAIEAIEKNGPTRGILLTVKRLLKCHPWGGWGYDPVE